MTEDKPGLIKKVSGYIKETQAEAKKVSWPDRSYVIQATVIILVMVIALSFLLMGIDYLLAHGMLFITKVR